MGLVLDQGLFASSLIDLREKGVGLVLYQGLFADVKVGRLLKLVNY